MSLRVYSPFAGQVVPLEQVPDDVFSQKMVGDGFAVIPEQDDVFAPVDGVVTMIFDTKHAFTIQTAGGSEVLVHMGLDTIRLNGAPFEVYIQQGDSVKVGQRIAKMDRAAIKAAGYQTITPVILADLNNLSSLTFRQLGTVKSGDAVLDIS